MRGWIQISVVVVIACAASAAVQAQVGVVQKMLDAVSADSLMATDVAMERAAGYYSRVAFTPGNDSSAQMLLRAMKRNPAPLTVAFDTFYVYSAHAPYDAKRMYNVYGVLPGKKDPATVVVIGAHFDSYAGYESAWKTGWQTIRAPGADDNATGVAAVLEMARIFTQYSSSGFSNDYTMMFVAFNCEEASEVYPWYLYGSQHFSARLKEQGYSVAAMIALDMIGFNGRLTADIVSDSASVPIGIEAVGMNRQYSFGLTMNAPPFVYALYSDHSPFWTQGYPAILIIEHAPPNKSSDLYTANALYHTSYDTLGAINPELVRRSTQLALATAASYSVRRPSSVTTLSAPPPFSSALGHNYPNPFNPTTRIPFTIASAQHVRIVVYDMLGRETARLLDALVQPGAYTIDWNAAHVDGGCYFCRMTGAYGTAVTKILVNK